MPPAPALPLPPIVYKRRTSKTDPIRIDWVPLDAPGRLGMTFAPGKRGLSFQSATEWRRTLRDDLAAIRRVGATDLVCLLEDHELRRWRIEALPQLAPLFGLRITRYPIRDLDVPSSMPRARKLARAIARGVERGRHIVVHCAGGLGRTGVVAGCALVEMGIDGTKALSILNNARGPQCPETPLQRMFVAEWA